MKISNMDISNGPTASTPIEKNTFNADEPFKLKHGKVQSSIINSMVSINYIPGHMIKLFFTSTT